MAWRNLGTLATAEAERLNYWNYERRRRPLTKFPFTVFFFWKGRREEAREKVRKLCENWKAAKFDMIWLQQTLLDASSASWTVVGKLFIFIHMSESDGW